MAFNEVSLGWRKPPGLVRFSLNTKPLPRGTPKELRSMTDQTASPRGETLAVRILPHNEDHHLWNNRGTWWCHFTLHRPDHTVERVRVSLRTKDRAEARERRDRLFDSLGKGGLG